MGGAAARGGGKNGHPPAKPAGVGKPPGKAGFASQMAQQKPCALPSRGRVGGSLARTPTRSTTPALALPRLLKVPPKAPAATGSR